MQSCLFVLTVVDHVAGCLRSRLAAKEVGCDADAVMTGCMNALQVELLGRERNVAQWKTLLSGAGFRLARIVGCRGPLSVIEAVPA